MYRKWNFIVRYYNEGVVEEDADNLVMANYDSYRKDIPSKSMAARVVDTLLLITFMPTMYWWAFSPFKYKWPKEIEAIFGKINYY